MLAQFDDSSLPYIPEYETSCGTDSSLPTTTTNDKSSLDAVVPKQASRHNNSVTTSNDNSNIAKTDASNSPHSSTSLVNVSGGGISTSSTSINNNKVIDQNQNLDWNSGRVEESGHNDNRSSNHHNNNSPVINTSHLIQIPVAESVAVSSSSSPRTSSQSKQNQKQKGGGLVTVSPYSQKYSNNCNKSKKKNANQMSASSSSSPAPITAISVAASPNIVEMNGNISSSQNKVSQQNNNGKGVASAAAIGGGTYSKGTSYEILIPKITSGNFNRDSSVSCGKGTITTSSHSSRASIMVPVIESQADTSSSSTQTTSSAPAQQGIVSGNVAKIRSQLNMGIFQPSQPQPQQMVVHHQPKDNTFHTTLVPVSQMEEMGSRESPIMQQHHSNGKFMKETASNMNTGPNGVSSTYITVSEGKSSLGQSSSSGVSSSLATMMMMKGCDEEQWNFPSEKNLPRSLRKTRKTCFLDDDNATDPKLAKPVRSESPFCCSESSNNGMSSSTIDHSDRSDHGSTSCYMGEVNGGGGGGRGHHQKSPRVIPRKGIPAKCEIINKGDGNFALAECSPSSSVRKIWNGQQQPHTTVVSTTSPYSSPVPNEQNHNRRKKIYEDVVLASQNISSPNSRRELPVSIQNSNVISSSSPSSTFTSSSGVSLSVTSNPNTFVDGDSFDGKNHGHGGAPSSKSRKSHQNPVLEQQQQMIPKPRIRQQIPSPGTEVPIPATNHFQDLENQFIPLGRSSDCEMNVYPSEVSCIPVTMSSHHSPINSVEIGTEQDEHDRCDQELEYDEDFEDDIGDGDISSNTSPIKTCHPDILMRNKSSDTDFEETASDSKVLEKTRRTSGAGGGKRGRSRIAKPAFGEGQNGSLPNQSQMMRMMMLMKGTGKNNSVGSASSSSRSSSSSGSVSVKSSTSSENNCGDVFHENIVQDYPTNIFNVGGTENNASGEEQASYGSSPGNDNSEGNVSKDSREGACEKKEGLNGMDKSETNDGRRTITTNGAVVVLRGRGRREEGRGNLQLANKQPIFAGATVGSQQPNNTTLEIDDGYLSMINRNEAPLYWPEEFIENETFSKAELKRLSVTLNEDTDVEDENGRSASRSPSQNVKIGGTESKLVGSFVRHHDRNSMSSSSNTSGSIAHPPQRKGGRRANANSTSMAGRSSTEKTDYFSDDSLEGDEMALLSQSTSSGKMPNNSGERVVVRAATSFVIPFNNTVSDEILMKNTSSNQVKKSNSQVSRIPKPQYSSNNIGRNNSTKERVTSGGNGHQNDSTSPTFPKPCSFFVPFSSEVQENLSSVTGGGSDRKLSAGDASSGRLMTNNQVALMANPLRSSSLPSSRRNSSSSNNAEVANKKQPVAWSISTATSTDDKKSRQQTDKASIDATTYVDTDLHYQSSDIRSQQGASSSSSKPSSVINNQNNKANITVGPTDSLLSNKENNKSNNCSTEKNSSVTITTKNTSDDHHDDDPKKVVIVRTSNANDDTSIFATTTITCPANSNSASLQQHESSGGSVSKRHKFQKQQTFILSSNSNDTSNISVAPGQNQVGQDDKAKLESESNNDLTTTKTIVDGNLNPKTMTTATTSSSQSNQDLKEKEAEKNCSESQQEVLNLWEKISDNSSDKNLAVRDDQGSSSMSKRNVSELNKNTSSTSIFTGTGKGSTSIDQVEGQENKASNAEVEDHHSASEELESVVKMFLKATEGLLDPEESNGEKIENDNLKSCTIGSDQKKREHRENVSVFHTRNEMENSSLLEESFDEIVSGKLYFILGNVFVAWFHKTNKCLLFVFR